LARVHLPASNTEKPVYVNRNFKIWLTQSSSEIFINGNIMTRVSQTRVTVVANIIWF